VNFSEQKENDNDDDVVDHKVVEKLKNNICFCGLETNNWSFVNNDNHTNNNNTYDNNANKHHHRQNFNRDDNYDNNYKNEINFLNITRVYSQEYIPFAFCFVMIIITLRFFWYDYLIFGAHV
jgi:hypothetical protein